MTTTRRRRKDLTKTTFSSRVHDNRNSRVYAFTSKHTRLVGLMAAVLQRQRTTDKSLLVARLRAVPRILILSATLTITTARKSPADFTPIAPINTGVTRAAHNKNQRQTAAQKTGRAGVLHPVPGFGCGLFADSSTDATLCRGDFESASLRRFSPRSMADSHRRSHRSRVPRARVMTAGSE